MEFAYNRSTSQTTNRSPFEIVYGRNPTTPVELVPKVTTQQFSADVDERAKEINKLHEKVRERIQKQNERYKQ